MRTWIELGFSAVLVIAPLRSQENLVISHLPDRKALFLTFDACGGPGGDGFDRRLLEVLKEQNAPATLFLTAQWISHHSEETALLAKEPLFRLQNHGARHRPASASARLWYGIPGAGDSQAIAREIDGGTAAVEKLTDRPVRWYRPAALGYDQSALDLLRSRGLRLASFEINADFGATASARRI